jgi:thymidine kinase
VAPLEQELASLAGDMEHSALYRDFAGRYRETGQFNMQALRVDCIAERALLYLVVEQNLVSGEQLRDLNERLGLDRDYLSKRLADNRRGDILATQS